MKKSRIHRFFYSTIIAAITFGSSCTTNQQQEDTNDFAPEEVLRTISDRVYNTIQQDTTVKLPRNVQDGEIDFTSPRSWTSGFFPGMLWMLNDFDSSRDWTSYAMKHTEALEEVKYETSHHDLGFMLYGSYGKGYTATQDTAYKEVLITGVNSLASRYNQQIGLIKSWDRPGKWQYPVIIDNMMNLEYFFWATRETGDSTYYHMAYSHAQKSMQDHYRSDRSCYHVVDYDTISTQPIWKGTHQGLANESVWARGQAWGLYGFTMAYRETGDEAFLAHANKIASYLMNDPKMPADKIPYWDLKDPEIPSAPRDVSAAAIIASALIELSDYSLDEENEYLSYATDILTALDRDYRYQKDAESGYFYLDKSVGNMPKGKEVSVPIIYADYYFIEALVRLKTRNL